MPLRSFRSFRALSVGSALAAVLAAIPPACGTSPAASTVVDASARDVEDTSCLCAADACRNGVEARITSPVPLAELAGLRVQVCRRLTDCMSAKLEGAAPIVLVDANVLTFSFATTYDVDPNGERYNVAVFDGETLLYYGAADTSKYAGKPYSGCARTIGGKSEACDPGRFACLRGTLDVTLARWTDGGVPFDAGSDAPVDATTDAPDAD